MIRLKKLALAIVVIAALFGCKSEPYIYNSAVVDYSGRFVLTEVIIEPDTFRILGVPVAKPNLQLEGEELRIYSTSADVATEIWVQCDKFKIKSKQTINGTPESFTSSGFEVNMIPVNYILSGNSSSPKVTKLPLFNEAKADTSLLISDATSNYCDAGMRIIEASIVKGGATSFGGNPVDLLTAKIALCNGTAFFNSMLRDSSLWTDPYKKVPDYGWQYKGVEFIDSTAYEVTIKGYRYTGLPEDEVNELNLK